jgi:hypothetical protein
MKIRRLSEIDLARICPLSREEKLDRLRLLKRGRPPHTYNPLRTFVGDILNLQPEMFSSGGEYTPWSRIYEGISRRATSDNERDFNLEVAEALYEFGVRRRVLSYSKPILPWNVGYGQSVSYWWNLYTVVDDEPWFIYVDPRVSAPLTRDGRKFVLSMMNQRIRVPDPDFVEARLLVAQFARGESGRRTIRLYEEADSSLYGFDRLNGMIGEAYELWMQALAEQSESIRRRPTGSNPFGF